jgi:hypothetical protein
MPSEFPRTGYIGSLKAGIFGCVEEDRMKDASADLGDNARERSNRAQRGEEVSVEGRKPAGSGERVAREGVPLWPAAVALLAVGALYAAVAAELTPGPRLLVPVLVALLVAALMSAHAEGRRRLARRFALALAAMVTVAMRHPVVDVLAHPTGRIVGGRTEGDFHMDALYAEAAKIGTVLEIDGDPSRIDLHDVHARAAIAAGCSLSVASDAHSVGGSRTSSTASAWRRGRGSHPSVC